MKLIRTFHPVGQGAFYTERHITEKKEFTVVYDCGSRSIRKKRMKTIVESTFPKNQDIDVLFISHFHEDHINGIKFLKDHCRIKRVVMPYIDDGDKVLLTIFNFMNGNYPAVLQQLIDNPKAFFGQIPIVSIKEFISHAQINNEPEYLTDIQDSQKESGIRFILGTEIRNWYYIPYNFKNDECKNQFIEALTEYSLTIDNINTIEKMTKHKKEIRSAYDKVKGGLNINSMVLFSGNNYEDIINVSNSYVCCDKYSYSTQAIRSGCLYTGDIDLNKGNTVSEIKNKLHDFYSNIGTLQIPHHGAIDNFNKDILDVNTKCAVVSYGRKNPYGHPSARVIEDIILSGVSICHIIECPCSIVIQTRILSIP
jgi:hypothetical protein